MKGQCAVVQDILQAIVAELMPSVEVPPPKVDTPTSADLEMDYFGSFFDDKPNMIICTKVGASCVLSIA